jgi:hypothetical protein
MINLDSKFKEKIPYINTTAKEAGWMSLEIILIKMLTLSFLKIQYMTSLKLALIMTGTFNQIVIHRRPKGTTTQNQRINQMKQRITKTHNHNNRIIKFRISQRKSYLIRIHMCSKLVNII